MSFKKVKGRGVPEWLYQRHLKNSSAFWIRYRKGGIKIQEALKGETPREAAEDGLKLLTSALRTNTEGKPTAVVRSEHLCDEIVALKKGKSNATYEGNEIMARVHVKPYLNQHCPYITDLNAAVWEQYKVHKRLANPTVALFNHWKFFLNLGKYARQKGLLREKITFEFDEEKEDFRKEGQVIPDAHLKLIVKHSNQVWRDRILLQRYTGMRPGEVRCLRKDRVTLATGIVALRKEDTKTRTARAFAITSPLVMEILIRRSLALGSDFFFPRRGGPDKPADRCLTGWENAIERANKELAEAKQPLMPADYTPHDLRHTFLTSEFKKPGANTALICYKAGLSMEEAQETYLHFTAADTAGMAEELAKEAALFMA